MSVLLLLGVAAFFCKGQESISSRKVGLSYWRWAVYLEAVSQILDSLSYIINIELLFPS